MNIDRWVVREIAGDLVRAHERLILRKVFPWRAR